MLHGKYDIDYLHFRLLPTRGHMFKLFESFSRIDTKRYFFTRRVAEPWNNLPQEVVCTETEDDLRN